MENVLKFLRKRAGLVAFVSFVSVLLALPIYYQTSSYPLAIVQGNSMYPNLQNGDLVLFQSVRSSAAYSVGTILIFVQGNSGISEFDSLTKAVVIHRIVGIVVASDGSIFYRTRGDNNALNDTQLVSADHILGTPVQVLPKAGLVLLFLQSPQGLVAIVAGITIMYLSKNETKKGKEDERKIFLGAMAEMVLKDELQEGTFRKIELATEYEEGIRTDLLKDSFSLALLDWLKKGGLEKDWNLEKTKCPKCSKLATSFGSSKENLLMVCPYCIANP